METYYTLKEAGNIARVKPLTLRKWCKEKKLPYYKIGKKLTIKESDLDTFIQKGKS